MNVIKALDRANSNLRYWRYRRRIGSPISLLTALSEWWRRLMFEMKERK